ncbi:MAG: hypothetical protein AAFR98_02230 [Pseudomonadota bacterium]
MMRIGLPLLAVLVSLVAAVVFARFVPLPEIFPYSDALLLGGMTTALAYCLACLLPDRWLFTQYERVQYTFRTLHGLPDSATDSALRLSAQAQNHARKLEIAAGDLKPEVQERVNLTADRLVGIARLIFADPRSGREYLTLIKRADIVTETVTKHARLMRNPFAKDGDKTTARQSVLAALDAFSGAYEGMKQKKIETDLADITLSGDIAEQLFDRMKGPIS